MFEQVIPIMKTALAARITAGQNELHNNGIGRIDPDIQNTAYPISTIAAE